MQRAFILDKNQQPLMPCHPARARRLLKQKKAAVYRLKPFTIILFNREGGKTQHAESISMDFYELPQKRTKSCMALKLEI